LLGGGAAASTPTTLSGSVVTGGGDMSTSTTNKGQSYADVDYYGSLASRSLAKCDVSKNVSPLHLDSLRVPVRIIS
jgi:hypothetical protein